MIAEELTYMSLQRPLLCLFLSLTLGACSAPYPNQNPTGEPFPSLSAEALDGERWSLPSAWRGAPTIALLGYVQDAQFDIDRWLIGLDMTKTKAKVYELPTIKGLFPRMFSAKIDEGMRKGIPKALWGGVITVYERGEALQRLTGNERPRNARVLLIDSEGVVRYFNDEGFSVGGLNRLREALSALSKPEAPAEPSPVAP